MFDSHDVHMCVGKLIANDEAEGQRDGEASAPKDG